MSTKEGGSKSLNSVHVVYGWPLNEIEYVCELKYKFIQIVYNKRSTVVYTRGNYKIILTLSGSYYSLLTLSLKALVNTQSIIHYTIIKTFRPSATSRTMSATEILSLLVTYCTLESIHPNFAPSVFEF